MSTAVLAGVTVVEAGDGVAMRLCGRLLADAGAEVLRLPLPEDSLLEQPYGRDWATFLDAGKPVVEDVHDALEGATLYLNSLSHDGEFSCPAVSSKYPAVTAACITPFGQSGPYVGLPSDDVVISALAGLSDATPGLPDHTDSFDDPPVQSLAPLAEAGGALIGAVAVFGALLPRLRGEPGPRHVEVPVMEAAAALMVSEWGIAAYDGGLRGRRPIPLDPAPNCYLATSDGTAVIVAPSPAHWTALLGLMGDPPWGADPDFLDGTSRCTHWDRLEPLLAAWTSQWSGPDLLVAAQARGLAIACSLELAETVRTEQVTATGAMRQERDRLLPADPIMIDGQRRSRPRSPSRIELGRVSSESAPPLAGVRVLDLGQFVAGPYCGQLLAALGAEVTLVEPPGIPVSRVFGPFAGEPRHDASALFNQINRGKRSVQLDLRSEAGRSAMQALVADSDVVLENFSRGAAIKLRLTYEDLVTIRPDVILASISGFGRRGPWGDYVALHSGVLLLSGNASVTRDDWGRMRLAGAIYPDVLTGTMTALGIEQALARRALSGKGSHVEIAMMDVLLNCMGGLLDAAAAGERFGAHPSVAFLRTAGSGFVAVSGAVDPALAEEAECLSTDQAVALLQRGGSRVAAVQSMEEVMRDPHLLARGFPIRETHPVAGERPVAAVPWLVDGERPSLSPSPCLGAATEEVLAKLRANPKGVSAS